MYHVLSCLSKFSRLLDKENIILYIGFLPESVLLIFVFLTCSTSSGPTDNGTKVDTTSHDFVRQIDTLGD